MVWHSVAFWSSRAKELGIEPFPLDAAKIKSFGSLLRAGGYRSAASYLSAVKMEHIRRGGCWTAQMAKEMADGARSCSRGQGPDKQSAEVDLDEMAKLAPVTSKYSVYWPAVGKDAFLVMGLWLLREMEGTTAKLGDVVLKEGRGCGTASWTLPFSKTDVKALGCTRTHGCSCPDPACPTAAMRRVCKTAELWARRQGLCDSLAPLLPDGRGRFVQKTRMVRYMQHIAYKLGVRSGVTGHAGRVSGARRMARAGVELWQIQLFARWESKVILRYVREAPLATSHLLAARMAENIKQDPHGNDASKTQQDPHGNDAGNIQNIGMEDKARSWNTTRMCLPTYVLNTRARNSKAKLHRPRDGWYSLCGWVWFAALQEGHIITFDSRPALASVCDVCERLSRNTHVDGAVAASGVCDKSKCADGEAAACKGDCLDAGRPGKVPGGCLDAGRPEKVPGDRGRPGGGVQTW